MKRWPEAPVLPSVKRRHATKSTGLKRAPAGASTVIASGRIPDVLVRLAQGRIHRNASEDRSQTDVSTQPVDGRPFAAEGQARYRRGCRRSCS